MPKGLKLENSYLNKSFTGNLYKHSLSAKMLDIKSQHYGCAKSKKIMDAKEYESRSCFHPLDSTNNRNRNENLWALTSCSFKEKI
jgi:hypothetical protein